MFNVDMKQKRVVIEHRVQALDGGVNLQTTFDLQGVPGERILLWAAANRLTEWIPAQDLGRLSRADVKKRFDNLIIDCKEISHTHRHAGMQEEEMIDHLRDLVKEGATIERVVQSLIRSTRKFDR